MSVSAVTSTAVPVPLVGIPAASFPVPADIASPAASAVPFPAQPQVPAFDFPVRLDVILRGESERQLQDVSFGAERRPTVPQHLRGQPVRKHVLAVRRGEGAHRGAFHANRPSRRVFVVEHDVAGRVVDPLAEHGAVLAEVPHAIRGGHVVHAVKVHGVVSPHRVEVGIDALFQNIVFF